MTDATDAAIPVPWVDGTGREPDPHGHAALLLVESLIHGLIARAALTVAEAVEIIDIAAEVKTDVAGYRGEDPVATAEALALLNAISGSLRRDLGE